MVRKSFGFIIPRDGGQYYRYTLNGVYFNPNGPSYKDKDFLFYDYAIKAEKANRRNFLRFLKSFYSLR